MYLTKYICFKYVVVLAYDDDGDVVYTQVMAS